MQLQDRVALVTGASSGIGAATARALHGAGARLVLTARRAERLAGVVEGATVVAGDITDPALRGRLLEACGGRLDILVNNAGYGEPGPVESVPESEYRRQFEVNVFAPGALIALAMPLMRRQRSGRIVNLSSVAGRFGYPLFGWYCASKHAVEGLTDALRLEAAPFGVHAVLVEPGPVRTEFFDVVKGRVAPHMADGASPYAPFFAHADAIEADFLKQSVSPEDVAAVILKACVARKPRHRYAVSAMAKTAILSSRLLPRAWFDAAIRKQFRLPRADQLG